MIAAFTIAAALLAEPDLPETSDSCRPAHASFTPIAVGEMLVLSTTELARIKALASSTGAGGVSVDAKERGLSSNDAVVAVSEALTKAGAERVNIMIWSGPRGGYIPRDPPPSLEVSVTVVCGA